MATAMSVRRVRPLLVAPLVAATLLASCGTQVVNPVTGQTERTSMDEASEITEGAKAHKDVLKEYGAVEDPKLQAYVNELGQRLARSRTGRTCSGPSPSSTARRSTPSRFPAAMST
jgi:predicted Zn-dependent protease